MRASGVLIAVVLILSGCGGGGGQVGNPEVLERIAGLSDCAELQQEFDTAEANGGETGTAYMKAADERMKAIDCY